MTVTVRPETFAIVDYDAPRIAQLAQRVLDAVGLGGRDLELEVNERTPLSKITTVSIEPLVLQVEGGALEDLKRPRQLSDERTLDALARVLFRVADRLDPAFGSPPPDEQLDLAQHAAWDTYAIGRGARLGLAGQRPRRLYIFRNRHGFTDAADAVFERLWTAEHLTWAELEAATAETAAARQPA